MCGIAGYYGPVPGGLHAPLLLGRMIGAIRHRGPQEQGIRVAPGMGLAHARLSIIDLAGGRQPMANEDQSLWLTFNGEIFNYIELRKDLEPRGHQFRTHSDTETILHLYEDMGEQCLEKLNGDFAFALWNRRRDRLLLARDRMGVRPLYYTLRNGTLLFASEIKALLQVPDNTVGELVIRGPHVMKGYWGNPAASDRVLRPGPHPWERVLYTGDLFRMDEDGFLYFVGRKDDILKTRGEKVSPREIENVLYALPGVREAAIIGVPDAVLGMSLKALIVRDEESGLTDQQVLRHCVTHLEDFMVPKAVEFRRKLPRTGTGKIRRSQLQAEAVGGVPSARSEEE